MPRPWLDRVGDILEAIECIENYLEDVSQAAFEGDPKTRDATPYNLLIIGEAASHIPEEVISRHPDIPWIDIRGMRNLIAHSYFAVKVLIVWKTVTEDLAPLKAALRNVIESEPED